MKSFIDEVVDALYGQYGDDISKLKILLPNKRAELFFRESLCRKIENPIWSPEFVSLQNLMASLSGVNVVDNVRLIIELYKVYSRHHNQSIDAFFFWGDVLLSDFDAIDKYLIDADVLFSNVRDIKELDNDTSYLTEEQVAIINRLGCMWLEPNPGKEKEHFITIWKTLASIYHEFKTLLEGQGLAYDGMAQRIVAQKFKESGQDVFEGQHYVVVGFNALTECEKILFKAIKNYSACSHFFWDYDQSYFNDKEHQAGLFIRQNVAMFKQKEYSSASFRRTHLNKEHKIKVVSAPSDSMQCKYVSTFLQEVMDSQGYVGKETAIVLTDENLLLPVLYSLPEDIGTVNITMGYPLVKTIAYAFVDRLIELQKHSRERSDQLYFYYKDVAEILSHPYVVNEKNNELLSEISKQQLIYIPASRLVELEPEIFCDVKDAGGVIAYIRGILLSVSSNEVSDDEDKQDGDSIERIEFLTTIIDSLNLLGNSLQYCELELSFEVMVSLIRKMLQAVRIPYEGEPLEGIQIMGILETRNLDFKNLLLLSACDDTFPGSRVTSNSFIPYNLRFAYGLPTPQHHEGVYAYYFYRLIRRADNVVLAYSSLSDEKKTGEPSRYIYQLEYGGKHLIEHIDLSLNVNAGFKQQFTIAKSEDVMCRLKEYCGGGRRFSPTSILSYIDCPMKFCLNYIKGIKPKDEVTEDIDMPTFGTILHNAMETLYKPLCGQPNPKEAIKKLINSEDVEKAVEDAVNRECFNNNNISREDYSGEIILIKDIVTRYINKSILAYDLGVDDFVVRAVEHDLDTTVEFETGGEQFKADFFGMADRVDILKDGGKMRIVDYKTGSLGDRKTMFSSIEDLFGS
ncbi:MAG: PD-(D/E)XK nuclease family protein, partial [Rikenellaceae bacterium]